MSRTFRRVTSLALVSTLGLAASCSSEPKERGQLMLALSADFSIPEAMNEVGVEVLDEDGNLTKLTYPLKPSDFGKPMPGTLALVPPDSGGQRIRVRVIGRLGETARVVREAIVVVPRDRVGLLAMPIRWLCEGQVRPALVGTFESGCEKEGQTCKAGKCEDMEVADEDLPDYEASALGRGSSSGKSGGCLDTVACFGKGVEVQPGPGCTLPAPEGGEGINVALVPSTRTDGICPRDNGDCYVPLDQDDADGFRVADGVIQLPPVVCERIGGSVQKIVVTTACATKDLSVPLCGPWSDVEQSSPVGGQTEPLGPPPTNVWDGGVDIIDGGGNGKTEGGIVVQPPDGRPDSGPTTCAAGEGNAMPLMRINNNMLIVLDGSSAMADARTTVESGLEEWFATARSQYPMLGVGAMVGSLACDSPPRMLYPFTPLEAAPPASRFFMGEFGVGDFPLVPALEATVPLFKERAVFSGPLSGAVVLITAGSPVCPSDMAGEIVSNATTQGVATHFFTYGVDPSPVYDGLASVAGTHPETFDTSTQLAAYLNLVAQTFNSGQCRFEAPGIIPADAVVSFQSADGGSQPLQYFAGKCADAPGYTLQGEVLELCGPVCGQFDSDPGAMLVASTLRDCTGGQPGVGGSAGFGGGPGFGGSSGVGGAPPSGGGGAPSFAGSSGQGGVPGRGGAGAGAGPAGGAPPADMCEPVTCPPPPMGGARCCISPEPGACSGDVGYGCGCPAGLPLANSACSAEKAICSYSGAECTCAGGIWRCFTP